MGLLARHARSPSLHFAKALSFFVCVQGRFSICASRSARFHRVRLAVIWLRTWKSVHSKETGSKHFPTGSHALQHRMSVPRCLFLLARNAVEAVNNLALRLSSVLREGSQTVCLLAFFKEKFEVSECAKWVSRVLVFFVKPLYNGTEDGTFGHPTWDAITLVSPSTRDVWPELSP